MVIKKWKSSEIISVLILVFIITYLLIDSFGSIIAIIPIEGAIGSTKSSEIIKTLDSIEKNPFIRAVVLRVDSPGGTATAVHEIYFKLLKLKSVKPVVTSVDSLAASGGYYIGMTSDYIFAKQSSEVGSIGALVALPTREDAQNILTSAPFKREPDEPSTFRSLEFIKQDFLSAVKRARGEKLKISLTELSEARVYIGFDALKLGLIDEIGTLEDAIIKAKSLIGIHVYRTITLQPGEIVHSPLFVKLSEFGSNTTTAPVFYYLYIQVKE